MASIRYRQACRLFDTSGKENKSAVFLLSTFSSLYLIPTNRSERFVIMEESNETQLNGVDLKDSIIKEALNSGVDLRKYSQQIEQQLQEVCLYCHLLLIPCCPPRVLNFFYTHPKQVELVSVKDYIEQGTSLARLHSSLMQCDVALAKMEDMLSTFRTQLGGLSSDILQLQHQSSQLGLRLTNRQAARSLAGQVIDDLVVPEQLIRHILATPVTESVFSEQLVVLQAKLILVAEQHKHSNRAAEVYDQALIANWNVSITCYIIGCDGRSRCTAHQSDRPTAPVPALQIATAQEASGQLPITAEFSPQTQVDCKHS